MVIRHDTTTVVPHKISVIHGYNLTVIPVRGCAVTVAVTPQWLYHNGYNIR